MSFHNQNALRGFVTGTWFEKTCQRENGFRGLVTSKMVLERFSPTQYFRRIVMRKMVLGFVNGKIVLMGLSQEKPF